MHVLVLGRYPADVSPAEMQAVACALRKSIEELEFVRIDTASIEEHRHAVHVHEPHEVCVLLDTSTQAPLVAAAVADGVPHFLFVAMRTDEGSSSLGIRLHRLLPGGEFTPCRRQTT